MSTKNNKTNTNKDDESPILTNKTPSSYTNLITIEEIRKAQVRIQPFVNRTPLVAKGSLCRDAGFSKMFFKCEALQRTGTFKLRGAVNFIMAVDEQHTDGSRPFHFVTHSSGNWGGAIAKAAKFADSIAHIVVPASASSSKVQAMKSLGAEVIRVPENTLEARELASQKIVEATPGSIFIHPHDDPLVIAAQGTVAVEFIEQFSNVMVSQERRRKHHEYLEQRKVVAKAGGNGNNSNSHQQKIPKELPTPSFIAPDVVILPLGGGGLLAGAAVAVRKMCGPKTIVIGAEPAFAPDAAVAFQTGVVPDKATLDQHKKRTRTHLQRPERTIADGLVTHISQPLFDLIKQNVDDIVTVTEQEIGRATVLIFQRLKIVVEPAAALAAAVAIFHRAKLALKFPENPLQTCVVLLSEGNIDVARINELAKL